MQYGEGSGDVVFGNVYDKYNAGSILERWLVQNYLNALESLCSGLGPDRVLEVGSGEGLLAEKLKGFLGGSVGLFLATDLRAGGRSDGVTWALMDATDLGVSDKAFDLVVACEVLEHLDDPVAAVQEMHRVCAGSLIISVPFEPIWRVGNMARGRYLSSLGNTPGHVSHFDPWSRKALLSPWFKPVRTRIVLPWILVLAEPCEIGGS